VAKWYDPSLLMIFVSPTYFGNVGHSGTLTTTINQQSDSTKVLWELAGVPTGQEEEITNNLRGY